MSKGIELPVNSVIVIALAIFVLLMIASFFGKSGSDLDKTQVQNAYNQGCSLLSSTYRCDSQKASEVKTGLVVNGKALGFLEVCRNYFNSPSMSALKCRNGCPTCGKNVNEDTDCEDPSDCNSPLTYDWKCDDGKKKCRAPNTQGSSNLVTE